MIIFNSHTGGERSYVNNWSSVHYEFEMLFTCFFFLKHVIYVFYLHSKLNFNNNSEKMCKFTIDWSTIMIISKTFEKILIIWFMYKEFDDRKGISVRFNCNSTILPMNACHERTSLYIYSCVNVQSFVDKMGKNL